MSILIDFCNKLIELKKTIMNNPTAKTIMSESLESGKIVYTKSGDYELDDDYKELQTKYNEIISSFNYDTAILVQIATDLCADLYYNNSELLVKEEFDILNALFVTYLNDETFKKKIETYMPSNKKIQEIIQIFKSEETPDNYNKRLLTILLFLKFKKVTDTQYVDKTYIKSNDYYIASYGPLEGNYRSSLDVGILEEIKSAMLPDLITGTQSNITHLLSIIFKMYKNTFISNKYDFTKLSQQLLTEYIGLMQKISEENIITYGPSIKEHLSTSTPNLSIIITFLRGLYEYLNRKQPSIDDQIKLKILKLGHVLQ
jgi:hypothetical protein